MGKSSLPQNWTEPPIPAMKSRTIWAVSRMPSPLAEMLFCRRKTRQFSKWEEKFSSMNSWIFQTFSLPSIFPLLPDSFPGLCRQDQPVSIPFLRRPRSAVSGRRKNGPRTPPPSSSWILFFHPTMIRKSPNAGGYGNPSAFCRGLSRNHSCLPFSREESLLGAI